MHKEKLPLLIKIHKKLDEGDFFPRERNFFSREGYISPSRGKLYKGTLVAEKGLFDILTILRCFSAKFLIY